MRHITVSGLALLAIPSIASAQATIQGILAALTASLSAFVPVGVAAAVAVFMWGIISFMYSSGDEKAIEVGRQRMVWGIVALFFIVSVWGIVAILQNMFDVNSPNAANNCAGITISEDAAETCL